MIGFVEAFNELVNERNYVDPLTQEQVVECAFGAGFKVGYAKATEDFIAKFTAVKLKEIQDLG